MLRSKFNLLLASLLSFIPMSISGAGRKVPILREPTLPLSIGAAPVEVPTSIANEPLTDAQKLYASIGQIRVNGKRLSPGQDAVFAMEALQKAADRRRRRALRLSGLPSAAAS